MATASRVSTVSAKNVQLRSNDYASSSSSVYLKSYDSCTTYDLYVPEKDPKYLDGVSGPLQIANQVFTYNFMLDKYEWKQAASAQVFLQGQTDAVGNDEMGNVMTIASEERVVAGDPLYDPTLPADSQVYKATYQFTDNLYNMNEFTAGKKQITTSYTLDVSSITHVGTTATATIASGSSLTTGVNITIAGVTGTGPTDPDNAIYNVSAVSVDSFTVSGGATDTFTFTLGSTPSADAVGTDIKVSFTIGSGTNQTKTTGLYFQYESGAAPAGSPDEQKQALDTLVLQTKDSTSGSDHSKVTLQPLQSTITTIDATSSTKSSLTLSQAAQEIEFTSDSSKFSVDNATKSISTDMETIEFGPAGKKHRLSVLGDNLYIQKYNSTSSTWVGADVVIDAAAAFQQAVLTFTTVTNTLAGLIDVVVAMTGTFDHFEIQLDDGAVSAAAAGATTIQITSTYIGRHKVVAYAADATGARVSELVTFEITTTL